MATFVLIHSPLVGPATWQSVATALRQRGHVALVPTLSSDPRRKATGEPYWTQHAGAVAACLRAIVTTEPVVLAGHSGAGPLLPAIRAALVQPVAAYLFVDAGLPVDGATRLDQFRSTEAAAFRDAAVQGMLPVWQDAQLREVIPDDALRQRFVEELRPLPLAVYEESLPVFSRWPDAPCGYLRFTPNPAYDAAAAEARARGWPLTELPGQHFHTLVDPAAVAEALVDLLFQLGKT